MSRVRILLQIGSSTVEAQARLGSLLVNTIKKEGVIGDFLNTTTNLIVELVLFGIVTKLVKNLIWKNQFY